MKKPMKKPNTPNTYRLETEEHDGKKYPTLVAWLRKPSPEDIARFCRENPGVMHSAKQLDKTACVFKAELAPPERAPLPPPGQYKAKLAGAELVGKTVNLTAETSDGRTVISSFKAEPFDCRIHVSLSTSAFKELEARAQAAGVKVSTMARIILMEGL